MKIREVMSQNPVCCLASDSAQSVARMMCERNVGSITAKPIACRDAENIDHCGRLMQEHQVRRVPVVDGQNQVVGIVSQADLALKGKPDHVSKIVAEISKPNRAHAAA